MSNEPFVTLGSSALGANKILTAPTVQALYDNPLAIARGAPLADRLSPWALQGAVTAGDTLRYRDPRRAFTSTSSDQDVTPFTAAVMAEGALKFGLTIGGNSGSGVSARLRRYRTSSNSNSTLTTWSNSGGDSTKSYTYNDVQFGDTFYIDLQRTSGTTVYAFDFTISTGGEYFWMLPPFMHFNPTQPT